LLPAVTAPENPIILYIDADACPVKQEVYRVAERHGVKVVVVSNSPMMGRNGLPGKYPKAIIGSP